MDFLLSEEQKMLKAMARDFAEKELEPVAAEIDEQSKYPAVNIAKLAELGMMGIPFPEKYGGSGGGELSFIIVEEELARVCASTATVYFVTSGLGGQPIYRFSNEEQRQRWIPDIASGKKISAFGLTEAGAGSDPAAMTTTAAKTKGGYILNGTKIFITNGAEADLIIVFATVDKSLKHKGITSFVVEKGMPGFTVGKHEHKLGIRGSSTCELIFQDCFVPEANRLGQEGEGFKHAIKAIDGSRVSVAAQALGIAQGAFDKALAYSKERKQFGQTLSNLQAIQWMLADMATRLDAARLLTYRAAWLQENDMEFIKEASMAKLYASEMSEYVTSKAIQIYGGYGFVKDYPLERYFRDSRITEIYEGTSEMQRMTIARQLLKD